MNLHLLDSVNFTKSTKIDVHTNIDETAVIGSYMSIHVTAVNHTALCETLITPLIQCCYMAI